MLPLTFYNCFSMINYSYYKKHWLENKIDLTPFFSPEFLLFSKLLKQYYVLYCYIVLKTNLN